MVFGFVSVSVNVVLPPVEIEATPNDFVTIGGTYTFNVLVAGLTLFPAEVCNAPAGIVFVNTPAVLLVTLMITVQPPAGMDVPFAIVKLSAPAVAVTPTHVPVFPAVLMVIPIGNVSVSALVNMMALPLELPMVTVRFVLPPAARSPVANDFVTVGADSALTVTSSSVSGSAPIPGVPGSPPINPSSSRLPVWVVVTVAELS